MGPGVGATTIKLPYLFYAGDERQEDPVERADLGRNAGRHVKSRLGWW